jgi:Flp pilus assembly pilin Flp
MKQRGQFAIEFALVCALLAMALLARGPNGESAAALWLSAWWQFVQSAHAWLAHY